MKEEKKREQTLNTSNKLKTKKKHTIAIAFF